MHLLRIPGATQAHPQQAEQSAECSLRILAALHDTAVQDPIAQLAHAAIPREQQACGLLVRWKQGDQLADCLAQRGCGNPGRPKRAEYLRPPGQTVAKPEIIDVAGEGSQLECPNPGCQGEDVFFRT